ncbi:MAG: hypothetical protein AAF938_25045 [Myxococcota bacterium]
MGRSGFLAVVLVCAGCGLTLDLDPPGVGEDGAVVLPDTRADGAAERGLADRNAEEESGAAEVGTVDGEPVEVGTADADPADMSAADRNVPDLDTPDMNSMEDIGVVELGADAAGCGTCPADSYCFAGTCILGCTDSSCPIDDGCFDGRCVACNPADCNPGERCGEFGCSCRGGPGCAAGETCGTSGCVAREMCNTVDSCNAVSSFETRNRCVEATCERESCVYRDVAEDCTQCNPFSGAVRVLDEDNDGFASCACVPADIVGAPGELPACDCDDRNPNVSPARGFFARGGACTTDGVLCRFDDRDRDDSFAYEVVETPGSCRARDGTPITPPPGGTGDWDCNDMNGEISPTQDEHREAAVDPCDSNVRRRVRGCGGDWNCDGYVDRFFDERRSCEAATVPSACETVHFADWVDDEPDCSERAEAYNCAWDDGRCRPDFESARTIIQKCR